MLLHEAFSKRQKYSKPRVGRGGKRGTSSGKGTKGQKSRAGRKIRPAEHDYIQRLPKLRGFHNKPHENATVVVNVGDFERVIQEGSIVSKELLQSGGKVKVSPQGKIKILGSGSLSKAWRVVGLSVSESAKKKIEAAGGSVVPSP